MLDPSCPTEILWCSLEDPDLNNEHLCRTLCRFVNEVRRKDGKEYPGRTLYDLVLCIQFHLEKRGKFLKLFDDPDFTRLKFTVDNLMKSCCSERLGSMMVSQPISFEQEEILWESGLLGEQNADQLRSTVLYLLGISFALRGGEEHRKLHCPGFKPQLNVMRDEKGRKYLSYTEDLKSKTNQGGISSRKYLPKTLNVYGNSENSDHDLVHLYENM